MTTHTNKQKWFYNAGKEVINQLQKDYKYLSCQYQVIDKQMIVEYWKGQNEDNVAEMILVTITKAGNKAIVQLHKTEYLGGFPVSIQNNCPVS